MTKLKNMLKLTGFKLGLVITLVTLVIYALGLPFFTTIDLKAYDLHFLTRGEVPPGDEVVIVSIDQKSVDALGRWPWPRYRIAELIERLNGHGAKVIAFDVIFAEPDESSGVSVMRTFKERFENREMRAAFEAAEIEADNDAKLSAVLKKTESVILGYFFFTSEDEVRHLKEKSQKFAEYRIPSRYSSIRYLDDGPRLLSLPTALAVERNIPVISEAASNFGYFNIIPDEDGTVRWVPLAIQYNNEVFSHVAVEAVRTYLGYPPVILNAAEYGVDSIQIGRKLIRTDERGRLLINFRGGDKTFPYYSVSDVLDGSAPAAAFKDKIVLVGASAIGIYDMRVVPFSGTFPGVEIHANIIDNILKEDAISRPDWVALFDVCAIILIGLSLSWLISRIRPLYATLVTIGLIAGYILVNDLIFNTWRIWLTQVYPVFTTISVFGGVTTYRFMSEERKKRELKVAFSRYVAPSLIAEILKDPGKLVLGGEERRLTVLFSDIRGFTTISEGLSPQALVKLINDYLTPMTEIVLRNGGTIDKYMGDAIMAFWGAPIWQEDHAIRACNSALQMLDDLKHLQAEFEKAGLPKIDIGIGLSTGKVTVGNMGSATRFDYTVMGDCVNLGSRLEGLNKEYGTHIIVPKYTYEEVKEHFVLRQLDRIKVKGKTVPVRIYELMGRKGDGRAQEIAGMFEAGLSAYWERDWEKAERLFSGVLSQEPGDGPSKAFLSRIENLRNTKLPADWDGVFMMTRK